MKNKNNTLEIFYRNIAVEATKKGKSFKQVSFDMGRNPNFLSTMKSKDVHPKLDTILAIADGIGCSVKKLFKDL